MEGSGSKRKTRNPTKSSPGPFAKFQFARPLAAVFIVTHEASRCELVKPGPELTQESLLIKPTFFDQKFWSTPLLRLLLNLFFKLRLPYCSSTLLHGGPCNTSSQPHGGRREAVPREALVSLATVRQCQCILLCEWECEPLGTQVS